MLDNSSGTTEDYMPLKSMTLFTLVNCVYWTSTKPGPIVVFDYIIIQLKHM